MRSAVFVLVVLGALSVSSAGAAPRVGPRTIGTRGAVTQISADGARVAIGVELKAKKTCRSAAAWTPATGSIVHFGGSSCSTDEDRSDSFVSLALAGIRVAWVDYDYGNHAYCSGPFTATLAAPKPVAIASDCDGTTADEYFDFTGDGDFLAMSSYKVCEVSGECTDENGNPLPEGVYDVTVSRLVGASPASILPPAANRVLLDANGGRILVWEPPGELVVDSGKGKKLASFPTGKATVYDARLDGDAVVSLRGRSLTVASISGRGPAGHWTLPAGAKLRDADGGVVVYTVAGAIHLLRAANGGDKVVARIKGLVDAELEPSGLFYAYNVPKGGAKPGRVTFVPRSRL